MTYFVNGHLHQKEEKVYGIKVITYSNEGY